MREKYFYSFIAGFVAGTAGRSFYNLGLSFSLFLAVIAFAIIFYTRFTVPYQKAGSFFLLGCFVFAGALGVFRFDLAYLNSQSPVLENQVGKIVSFKGIIDDEVDEREDSVRLRVGIRSPEKSHILLTTDLYPAYQYGDEIEFSGKLEKPKNFKGDSDREFDYVSYLAKEGIYFEMYRPKISLTSHGHGSFISEKLFKIKRGFVDSVGKILPMPHSALVSGLTIGAKQSLGKDLLEDFRRAGVIHIVVLSGYNISIVALFVMWIFSFLPKRFGMGLGALSIFLFAIMTGGSATIVRASIMALLVVLAKATGRSYDMSRALVLAGFLMILHNPKILIFDISFQLSFLATLALIYVSPLIEKRLVWVPEKFHLREVATATISTQIFVLPFILYTMGQLSLVALPVNLLILLFIPATMLFGFLAGSIGFISSILAMPFGVIAYFLLSYELSIVEFFSHLPFAALSIPVFPFWIVILVYGFYVWFLWRNKKPRLP
jgi:competence protein ComEC